MAILMKNPATGFTWPIHSPLRGINLIWGFYNLRFWFAGYLALKGHRRLGLVGLLSVIAVIASASINRPTIASWFAILYIALGLYFGPKIPRLQALHYLAKGWEFAEPDSEDTRTARRLWSLDGHAQDRPVPPSWKRWLAIGLGVLWLLVLLGFAFSTPSAASLTRNLDRAVTTNAQGWYFNKYDAGSLKNVRVIRSDGLFAEIIGADYTFNSGTQGWLLARVRLGHIQCLQYWDKDFVYRSIRGEPRLLRSLRLTHRSRAAQEPNF